jgi:hypothetical protein
MLCRHAAKALEWGGMRASSGFCFFLALTFGSQLSAATYEVAQRNPNADDGAPGSGGHPWKTIARAAEVARAGDVVLIRGASTASACS